MISPYTGAVDALPAKWRRAYEKRFTENMQKFGMKYAECQQEARLHVARLMYLDESRRTEDEKQMALFNGPLPPAPANRKSKRVIL